MDSVDIILLEICKLHDGHVCKTASYIYHKSVIEYPRIGVEMITVLNNHKPTFKMRQSRFVVRDLKVLDSSITKSVSSLSPAFCNARKIINTKQCRKSLEWVRFRMNSKYNDQDSRKPEAIKSVQTFFLSIAIILHKQVKRISHTPCEGTFSLNYAQKNLTPNQRFIKH